MRELITKARLWKAERELDRQEALLLKGGMLAVLVGTLAIPTALVFDFSIERLFTVVW
jgi:hypothetical protein